jgi:hypothetical protein
MVAACNFDLTNQVGYHRLRIRLGANSHNFDFHTSTAKATRDEILSMAEVCGQYYLGFRRQFSYVAATGERRKILLPQIHFAWLRDRIDELKELTQSINLRPAMISVQRMRPSTRGKGISLSSTIRLLHERPNLLEEREDGPIALNGKRYWPALVMQKVRNAELASREHASIARFIDQLLVGCRDLRKQVESDLYPDVDRIERDLLSILNLAVLSKARMTGMPATSPMGVPTQIERSDARYARIRALRSEYLSDIGPSDRYEDSIRANVKDVWEIYQTFVTHVVGNALGLGYSSTSQDLRDRGVDGASMRSAEWILGFDTKPPGAVLVSWRNGTARPAEERPDISLISSTSERSILFDAKFRVAKNLKCATQPDLFEMQGYLNSFSIHRGGIIYPGSTPASTLIEAGNNRLVELPIRASFFTQLGGKDGVHEYVRNAIERALQPAIPI